ncbi:MAG TPA: LytTR family DNA-binding domain-containing protein [Chitinophagaceae bacterium]|jgi:DNA-binding LytR/AlgR family response regulator|nr:LytTR family DNA-binding domain-containing protein [Chitinophagaceae bacterium]
MKCIIVDDEPKAIDVLERYVANVPFLELLETFRDSMDALNYIQRNPADLIFLDINMPNLTGIELAKLLDSRALFIFTTAYSEHAIEGYELNAVDYLVKPILFERFLKACTRAHELKLLRDKSPLPETNHPESNRSIFFKSGTAFYKINISDIYYLEKEGNYFFVYATNNRKIIIRTNFENIESLLPASDFYRVHKSYFINMQHIEMVDGGKVIINKTEIPIGHLYKDGFMKRINKQ